MKNPEISIKDIVESYKKFWWLVVAVLIVGVFGGLFLHDVAYRDIVLIEFSLPVVVREQPIEEWKPEDTYALKGFVDAWLDNEWQNLASSRYSSASVYSLLRNDNYIFRIELEYQKDFSTAVRQAMAEELKLDVSKMADELAASFQYYFISSNGFQNIQLMGNGGCLTDAGKPGLVNCIPMTLETAKVLRSDTFDMGEFLWVGEHSAVTVEPKLSRSGFVKIISAILCAEMALFMVFLIDLTRKSAKVE